MLELGFEIRDWIEDCHKAVFFFVMRKVLIWEDLQGVISNYLMQLMPIFWLVLTWQHGMPGMSKMKLCRAGTKMTSVEFAVFCQAQKKLAVVITDSPCYGKDFLGFFPCAWSEI